MSTASADLKKNPRRKELVNKHGHRLHPYDNEKAPYPLSYNRDILEMESLDNRLVRHLRGSVSFVNFKESPLRVLDLGCGTGSWVIEAAKEWPLCEFVGFDLVEIQLPIKLLDRSIANRIEWRHGNFLTSRLPFDEDEFDHVHMQSIASGVPENKWGVLFEVATPSIVRSAPSLTQVFQEVSRVLKPGGSVEVLEDDVVFPWLPKWFTEARRVRPLRMKKVHSFGDSELDCSLQAPPLHPRQVPDHDHALLESLYKSVFEHRFINLKPSGVLPSYLTTYFRQVTLGPVVSFPMPPLPPVQPLPSQIVTSYMSEPLAELLDPSPTSPTSSPFHGSNRPLSLSFSSSISTVAGMSHDTEPLLTRPRTASAPYAYSGGNTFPPFNPLDLELPQPDITTLPVKRFMLDNSLSESEISALPEGLFPMERIESLSERSLAMHLYRSFQCVLACQEAMWEELKDRIRNRREDLSPFGWDDDEELEELQSRKRFEKLVERYKSDMYARVSLWCSLDSFGWPIPAREPLSKAELIEEERLRERMIEARKEATVEEMHVPCRSVRVVLGYKL